MSEMYEVSIFVDGCNTGLTNKFKSIGEAVDCLIKNKFECSEISLGENLRERFRDAIVDPRIPNSNSHHFEYVTHQVYYYTKYSWGFQVKADNTKRSFKLILKSNIFLVVEFDDESFFKDAVIINSNSILLKRLNHLWSEYASGKDMILDLR